MGHLWRWHGRTRVPHGTRLTIVGLLLACALLATLPAMASASAPEVSGEWALTVSSSAGVLHGVAHVTQEANTKGEFAAAAVTWQEQSGWSGTFTCTLEGATATVETSSAAFGPVPGGKFKSTEMKVEEGLGTLALSGKGMLKLGSEPEKEATETLTRVKSQKQIEEQEAKERKEHEEAQARQAIRGEWALTLESVAGKLKGIALIATAANSKNEFASSSALFEGIDPASFEGKLEGGEATVKIITQAGGGFPEGKFTASGVILSSASNPASMSGTGTFTLGQTEIKETKLTATRIRTEQEIEHEQAEREAKEKQEKEAQEAAEKATREKHEQEQKARELKERQEREAREAAEKAAAKVPPPAPAVNPLVPVTLAAKTLTLSHGGAISLGLTNPGNSLEYGHLKLVLLKAGKAASTKSTTGTLGEASFSIAPHGSEIVKVKLSKSGRAQLTRHKTLRVLVSVTTQASGQPEVTKTHSLTLRAPSAHHKH
jgi:hypothetical protein